MIESYKPQFAVLEITNRCNMKCIHCASNSGVSRQRELNSNEFIQLIDDLKELGCKEITLLGGEPFLNKDWDKIAKYIVELKMKLIIVSNGLIINQDRINAILRINPDIIAISLDGAKEQTYKEIRGVNGFNKTLEVINTLSNIIPNGVNVITTFNQINIKEFDEFIPLFVDKPIRWQIQIAGRGGERFSNDLFLSLQDYELLINKITNVINEYQNIKLILMDDFGYFPLDPALQFLHSWGGCQAGISVVGIRSNGDILPCLSLGDDFIVSNIRKEKLKDIWNNEDYFKFFRHKEKYLTGACSKCMVKDKCRGGCSDIAFSTTGSIFENPYCIRALETRDILKQI